MAGFNQMFGQLKGKAENLTTRITENSALEKDGVTLKALKQRKASLIQEKQKYFGYLGMAVYEMHKEQGLEFKEFSMDLEKLAEFDKEITDLNQQIEAKEQERIQSGKNVCVNCGAKLEERPVSALNAEHQSKAIPSSAIAVKRSCGQINSVQAVGPVSKICWKKKKGCASNK